MECHTLILLSNIVERKTAIELLLATEQMIHQSLLFGNNASYYVVGRWQRRIKSTALIEVQCHVLEILERSMIIKHLSATCVVHLIPLLYQSLPYSYDAEWMTNSDAHFCNTQQKCQNAKRCKEHINANKTLNRSELEQNQDAKDYWKSRDGRRNRWIEN